MVAERREHDLAPEVRRLGLRLYQVRDLLGGSPSESTLSRMLSGIKPMAKSVETKLRQALKDVAKSR